MNFNIRYRNINREMKRLNTVNASKVNNHIAETNQF